MIQKDHPHFSHDSFLAVDELNQYRARYITESLRRNLGELTELEQTVLDSLIGNTTLTNKIDGEDQQVLTTGQRISDKMAAFGGSWPFINPARSVPGMHCSGWRNRLTHLG